MTPVRTHIEVQVIGQGDHEPLPAHLDYDPAAPFEVNMTFGEAPYTITWTFARDLLSTSAYGPPAGLGDVRFWNEPTDLDGLYLSLCSPSGMAAFRMPAVAVRKFYESTCALVLPGLEGEPDLDAELAELLGGAEA